MTYTDIGARWEDEEMGPEVIWATWTSNYWQRHEPAYYVLPEDWDAGVGTFVEELRHYMGWRDLGPPLEYFSDNFVDSPLFIGMTVPAEEDWAEYVYPGRLRDGDALCQHLQLTSAPA